MERNKVKYKAQQIDEILNWMQLAYDMRNQHLRDGRVVD